MVTSAGGRTGVVMRCWWTAVAGGGGDGLGEGSLEVVEVHAAPMEECSLAASQHEAVETNYYTE